MTLSVSSTGLVQEQKCDVIFTTSFGYMDDSVAAAEKYPDVQFYHCSGYKRSANLGTYMGDMYQIYYLNGLIAGLSSESNKIGYVAAFPIPELFPPHERLCSWYQRS